MYSLIVIGVMMLGYLIPEIYVCAFKVDVPVQQNILSAIGCGLIAGVLYG